MAGRHWLVFDCNYLGWRAFHSTGGLSHNGGMTGVMYGFWSTVCQLAEVHATRRLVFCFDRPPNFRVRLDPGYKGSRRDKEFTEDEQRAHRDVTNQLKRLRRKVLPKLGYRNVFATRGYEADDLLASVCRHLPVTDTACLVTGDHDLYQLLTDRVTVYHPGSQVKPGGNLITREKFVAEYRIEPAYWPTVKALAGCASDDVPGIKGVGEKRACQHLRGQASAFDATIKAFMASDRYALNRKLVTLPFEGTPVCKVQDDELDLQAWLSYTDYYGMKTLVNRHPGSGFQL